MEIITIANYRAQYPADQYQDTLITTAINMSFDILNYKYSGNVIAERWEKSEETGGFTEAQKEHIRRAFLIQTRYYLQTGLRQAPGSIQRTSGSVGLNINVPNRDEVQQGAILALEAAGITSLMSSQGGKVRGVNECEEINLSKYATIDLVKAMCLQTQYTPSEGRDQKKNKIVKYNDDAVAEWVSLDAILSNYQTRIDNALITEDKSIVGAINYLATHGTNINWDTEPTADHGEGYAVTSEGIKTYVDNNLELKQNIIDTSLGTTEKRIVPAINEVVGNLEYVAQEVGYVRDDLTIERTQRQSADSALQTEKQDKTDNSLTTTAKTIVGAINELRAQIERMKIEVGGLYASTINYTPEALHNHLGYGTWVNICDDNNRDYLYLRAISYDSAQNPGGGNVSEQSLPNIKGQMGIVGAGNAHAWMGTSGAFTAINQVSDTNGIARVAITAQTTQTGADFNAHDSNTIYQDNANVHPTNYSVCIFRRIA